jgi:hypothetical protein
LRVVETDRSALNVDTGTSRGGSSLLYGSDSSIEGRELNVTESLGSAGFSIGRETDLENGGGVKSVSLFEVSLEK